MKLLLQKAVSIFCVLLIGFIFFVVLELVMFSANLNDWQAALPFYTVLGLILWGVVRGVISASKDEHYLPDKENRPGE